MAGMPSIQYHLNASEAADDEFAFLTGLLTPNLGQTQDWAFTAWTGFSYTARHLRQLVLYQYLGGHNPKFGRNKSSFCPRGVQPQ